MFMLLLPFQAAAAPLATLTAYAELPADTFIAGPSSGQYIDAANGRNPPFVGEQPVQGFSALIKGEDDSYLVLSDNGFGKRSNSADYLLSIYQIGVDFRTAAGGSGAIKLLEVIRLSDPQGFLPYPATREQDHLLTGSDFDPESFRRLDDGSFWIGEEFLPSIVHVDANGRLLAPPFKLEGLAAMNNPQGEPATLPASKGFEGMAMSPDKQWLYPMLEDALTDAGPGLNIYTFDVGEQVFINPHATQPSYRYRLDNEATAIGDFTMFSGTGGLVIERDSAEGDRARHKKIYRINFNEVDDDGFLSKFLVADLLDIQDPLDLNRDGNKNFRFPFWTIEGLEVINRNTLGLVNDNNYPFGQARDSTGAHADGTEFILIEVAPLWD